MEDATPYWGLNEGQWTRSGLTLAEGATLARRLLASPLAPEAVHCLPSHEAEFTALAAGRCAVHVLTAAEMDQWAGFAFHRGVVAIARRPQPLTLAVWLASKPTPRRLAVAPALTDPENLGSVFRSALALGWDAVAVGPQSCDPFSRRCAKVSMGAVYSKVPVELPPPGQCRALFAAHGWTNVALALEPGAHELEAWVSEPGSRGTLAGPLGVWVGSEFDGLSPAWRSVCDLSVVLPMAPGHDSLNASVATAIALYRLAGSSGSEAQRGGSDS
jgi:tRNA G18 (ribose-2'-O)-methylase SpoU